MPTLFSAFGRRFSPSWLMTLLTLALFALFVSLGNWQWQRGAAKQASWEQFERTPVSEPARHSIEGATRFQHLRLEGRYEPERQFLLDNRSHAGRPGYEVLTPFALADGRRLLVNRGWIPFSGYREQLPDVAFVADAPTQIAGRLDDLPAAGLASGRAPPAADGPWPKLTSFPTREELEAALGMRIAERILLLDPRMPDGYLREWSPPGLAPERHFSYAIQWWGFAVVLLVLYFGLNFRKVS